MHKHVEKIGLIILIAACGLLAWATPGDAGVLGVVQLALITCAALAALFLLFHRKAEAPKPRNGLLTDHPRAPLSTGERQRMLGLTVLRMNDTSGRDPAEPDLHVAAEIKAIAGAWREIHGEPFSDDEIRSLYQLLMYADPGDRPMSRQPQQYLRDVRNAEPFHRLRNYVEDWRSAPVPVEETFQDWLDHVGDPSVNHLLLNGWVRFLQSLPGDDIALWHSIATNFRGIGERDRLDAAFWILEQPECDQATASEFIRGVAGLNLVGKLAKRGQRTGAWRYVDAYCAVIKRYNSGFYFRHSIKVGGIQGLEMDFGLCELEDRLAAIAKAAGQPLFPVPDGLLPQGAPPSDPMPDGYSSPYDFDADAGLYLKYPGRGWRSAS